MKGRGNQAWHFDVNEQIVYRLDEFYQEFYEEELHSVGEGYRLEPCPMCAGAIVNSRIPRVVFGARDHRFGAFGSVVNLAEIPLNHTPEVSDGVRAEECADLLSSYFKRKRAGNK